MKKLSPLVLAAIAAITGLHSANAQTHSITDGSWGSPGTWNNGVPANGLNGTAAGVVNGNTVTFTNTDSYFGGGGLGAGLHVGHSGLFGPTGSGTGTLNVTGGLLDAGYLSVGHNFTGIVNVSGGTFQSGAEAYIGFGAPATSSAVNVTGGTFNLYGGSDGVVGQNSAATVNVSGTGTFAVNRNFYVKNNSVVNVSTGGTMNVTGANGGQFLAQNGTVNVNGGTVSSTGSIHVGYNQTATLSISSGTVTNTGATYLGFIDGTGTITQTGSTATYQDI